jgi:hypothetical protein
MFQAPLCSSSGAREYYTKLLLLVVFGAVKMEIVTGYSLKWKSEGRL